MSIELTWSDLVEKYLSCHMYESARFYAERLYYDQPCPENVYSLALCYFHMGKVKQTYLILQDVKYVAPCPNTPASEVLAKSQYLLALCCVQLGKFEEAEAILQPFARLAKIDTITKESVKDIPGGAAGVFLMGKICRRQHRRVLAQHYYRLALEMDPLMWSAIVELSELGEIFDIQDLVEANPPTVPRKAKTSDHLLNSQNREYNIQAARKASLSALDKLTNPGKEDGHTPASSVAMGVSSMSLRMPFASPGSMPSPITKSMLTGGKHVFGNDTRMGSIVESPLEAPYSSRVNNVTSYTNSNILDSVDRGDVNPRGALFGGPTPSNASMMPPPSRKNESLLDTSDNSDLLLADQSVLGDLSSTSAFIRQHHHHNNPRRVSFGPPARLSFSGAFDGHHGSNSMDSADTVAEKAPAVMNDFPNKLQKMGHNSEPSQDSSGFPSPIPSLNTTRPTPHSLREASQHNDDVERFADQSSIGLHGTRERVWSEEDQAASMQHNDQEEGNKEDNVDDSVVGVVAVYSRALQQLYNYYCLECIETLETLPSRHFRSGLTSHIIGKAYTEMNEYNGAVLAFREMIRLESFRTQGLETLSAALWLLREDKALSALAQQAVDVDKYSPEAWCVVGNCFSLQKEPEMAIKFFKRALQLDQYFTYAYTLSGHEYVNNEDMEKAIAAFRQAIFCNERHYNAWYGLGSIYYRQERFEMSEYHFRKAREINARSSVLDCYLGMSLNAQGTHGKIEEALEVLTEASIRDPKNPQLRFQRAHILFGQDRLDEALDELLKVEEAAPKEPPVHAMLGQIYQQQGEVQLAMLHLNIALDLDPKEANTIKAIMDNFSEPQFTM